MGIDFSQGLATCGIHDQWNFSMALLIEIQQIYIISRYKIINTIWELWKTCSPLPSSTDGHPCLNSSPAWRNCICSAFCLCVHSSEHFLTHERYLNSKENWSHICTYKGLWEAASEQTHTWYKTINHGQASH